MFNRVTGLISDTVTYGASSVLRQIIAFFLLPLYTSYLTPEDYGITAMLGILVVLFIPLANLGMTNAIFRRFNLTKDLNERRHVLSTGLMSLLISTIVLFLIGQVFADQLTSLLLHGDGSIQFVRLTLVTALVASINQAPIVVLRANRRVRFAAGLNIFGLLTSISVTILFVVILQMGVIGVILGSLSAEVITAVIAFLGTKGLFEFKLKFQLWKEMLSYGLPFLPHRIQGVGMVMFGQYAVGRMLGIEEAGLYNVALKFVVPLKFTINAIQRAWVPYKFQIHAEYKDPREFFRVVVTYYIAVIFYIWLGISIWGPEVLKWMTPKDYHAAGTLIWALAFAQVCVGLYYMFGTGFGLTDNTKSLPLVSLLGFVVLVTSSYALIFKLGALGAALATAAGWLCMASVIFIFAQRRYMVNYNWLAIVAFEVLAIVFFGFFYVFQDQMTWIRITINILLSIAYPLLVLFVLWLMPEERKRIHQLSGRIQMGIKKQRLFKLLSFGRSN